VSKTPAGCKAARQRHQLTDGYSVSAPGTPAEGWDRDTWPPFYDLAKNHPEAGVHFLRTETQNRKKDVSSATGAWFANLLSPNPWFKTLFEDVSVRMFIIC
jgi:hypothetical protein